LIGTPLQREGQPQESQPYQQTDRFDRGQLIPGMQQSKEDGLQANGPLTPSE
jgi:hypothetical protein